MLFGCRVLNTMVHWGSTVGFIQDAAWSPHYQKDKQLLEKVQHRFTRLFPHLRNVLSWPAAKAWVMDTSGTPQQNWSTGGRPIKIKGRPSLTVMRTAEQGVTRGLSWKIVKNRSKLDIRKYFFSERVVGLNRWNCHKMMLIRRLSTVSN